MCGKGKIKKENIYIIEPGCVKKELTFLLFSLISEKTMYTGKKGEKHTTRQQLWRKIIDGECERVLFVGSCSKNVRFKKAFCVSSALHCFYYKTQFLCLKIHPQGVELRLLLFLYYLPAVPVFIYKYFIGFWPSLVIMKNKISIMKSENLIRLNLQWSYNKMKRIVRQRFKNIQCPKWRQHCYKH